MITGATVRRIVTDEHGLACGAEWIDREGRDHVQAANVVVCAANAIGTARLLLASRRTDGLANSSGLVGRNLMLHPLVSVIGLFDEPLEGWRAHAGGLIQSLEFARSEPGRGFVRGATWALGSAGGPLRAAFAPDGQGRWGEEHHANVRQRLGRTASWVIIAEDLPDPRNRVELSSTLTDSAGLPAPSITYRLGDNTRLLMDWHVERARESLDAAGAWHWTWCATPPTGTSWAPPGWAPTRRPRWSIPGASAHDVPNLLVVDGSVFVTAGSANPTSTIAAVALRAADRLVEQRADVPVPSHRRFVAFSVPAPPLVLPADVADPMQLPTPSERAVLRTVVDALVPAAAEMPSASQVGVCEQLLDRVLLARPDLAAPLREAIAALPGDVTHDPRFATLRYVVAAAVLPRGACDDALGLPPRAGDGGATTRVSRLRRRGIARSPARGLTEDPCAVRRHRPGLRSAPGERTLILCSGTLGAFPFVAKARAAALAGL